MAKKTKKLSTFHLSSFVLAGFVAGFAIAGGYKLFSSKALAPLDQTASLTNVKSADINSDGTINNQDLSILLSNWGSSGPSDLNQDGRVDAADLNIMLAKLNSN